MFFLYVGMTCSLKLNISKCDQFLKWQEPITLFKNTYSTWAADLQRRLFWLVG